MHRNVMKRYCTLSALILTAALSLVSCSTPPAYYDNVKKVFPAVVRVVTGDKMGSGVVVTKEGYVLTGQHVVGNDKTATVQFNSGTSYQGTVITADQARDLAVIKLPENASGYPYAFLGNSNESNALQTGSPVLVIGYPAGNDIKNLSLTTGVLCAFPRMQSVSYLQSEAKVSAGSSGGPMTNSAGEVIGIINSQYTNMEGRCATFATASSEAKSLLDQLAQGKPATASAPVVTPSTSCSDVGCPAPNFTLSTPDGKQVTLSSLKGKKVVLAFVSTRCGTCLETTVCLQDIYKSWSREQLEIIAVISQEKSEDVQRWAKMYGFTNPAVLDTDSAVYNRYRPDRSPVLYFLDKDGIIKSIKYPPIDDCAKSIDALLRLY
jgi:peroxiredoxin/V8-like Glu-specific endopeptidase